MVEEGKQTEPVTGVEKEEFHEFFVKVYPDYDKKEYCRIRMIQHSEQSVRTALFILLFIVLLAGFGFCQISNNESFFVIFFPLPLALFCLYTILNCLVVKRLAYAWCSNVLLCLVVTLVGKQYSSYIFILASITGTLFGTTYRMIAYVKDTKGVTSRYAISIQDLFLFTLAMGGYFFCLTNHALVWDDETISYGIAAIIVSCILSISMVQFLNRAKFWNVWFFYLTLQPFLAGIVGLFSCGWMIGLVVVLLCLTVTVLLYLRKPSFWPIWLVNTGILFLPGGALLPTFSPDAVAGYAFAMLCSGFSLGIYMIVILGIPFLFCQYMRDGKNFLKDLSGKTQVPLPESSGKSELGPLDRDSEVG